MLLPAPLLPKMTRLQLTKKKEKKNPHTYHKTPLFAFSNDILKDTKSLQGHDEMITLDKK